MLVQAIRKILIQKESEWSPFSEVIVLSMTDRTMRFKFKFLFDSNHWDL